MTWCNTAMKDIVLRNVENQDYYKLLEAKDQSEFDNWRDFFMDKVDI